MNTIFSLLIIFLPLLQQTLSFEVATIKPVPHDERRGMYATMQSAHEFMVVNYSLKHMISFAYTLPLRAISGGPAWTDSDSYDIKGLTPGDTRPTTEQQELMLRSLLADRFKLKVHTVQKEQPVYALTALTASINLKESTASSPQPDLVNRGFPDHILLPARNATMAEFAAMMGRAVLDRPVVDRTGLSARYDFDLEWTPDETQFNGTFPAVALENVRKPDLFSALQKLGLKLEPTRAVVDTLVIDNVERPTEN